MKVSSFLVLYLIITNFCFSFCQYKDYSVFEHMYKYVKGLNKMKRIAVAGADNLASLQTFRKLKDLGIADFILVGQEEKIDKIANENNIDISDFEMINKKEDADIAQHAAELVKMGIADIYYKGSLNYMTVLKAIFEDNHFIKNKLVTGLSVMDIPKLDRPIILTDTHVKAYPTINQKIELINNAVEFAQSIGIKRPKVAIVAGIGNISREMRETEDASRLTKLNDMGQIKGCDVEGPLAFDVAVDPFSKLLNYLPTRKIRGDADIILFHNYHHANIAYQLLLHTIKARSATLLGGTRYPVVFCSRSGSAEYKFDSIITAIFFSEYTKNKNKGNILKRKN